jgi:hypothetical protein
MKPIPIYDVMCGLREQFQEISYGTMGNSLFHIIYRKFVHKRPEWMWSKDMSSDLIRRINRKK